MGTYKLKPDSFSIASGTFSNQTGSPWSSNHDNNILSGLLATSTDPNIGQTVFPVCINSFSGGAVLTEDALLKLGFSITGAVIALDGNPAISFAGLPSGFTFTSATVNIFSENNGSDSTNHFRLQLLFPFIESLDLGFGSQLLGSNGPFPTPLSLFGNAAAIHVNNLTVGQQTSRWFDNFSITGSYKTVSSLTGLSVPASANAGDKVTINATNGAGGVARVHIQYIDSNNNLHDSIVLCQDFIVWTDTQIVFYMPQFGNFTGTVYLYLDSFDVLPTFSSPPTPFPGTTFSGTVLAGSMTVTFADSSGIYVLNPGRNTDTIYDRSSSGATKVINILDPTAETAFVP